MQWIVLILTFSTFFLTPQQVPTSKALKEYRILSVSESSKLVLISDLTTKTRYLLDATNAKIILDGKEIELVKLQDYSTARVSFSSAKKTVGGVKLDGVASRFEIKIKK